MCVFTDKALSQTPHNVRGPPKLYNKNNNPYISLARKMLFFLFLLGGGGVVQNKLAVPLDGFLRIGDPFGRFPQEGFSYFGGMFGGTPILGNAHHNACWEVLCSRRRLSSRTHLLEGTRLFGGPYWGSHIFANPDIPQ